MTTSPVMGMESCGDPLWEREETAPQEGLSEKRTTSTYLLVASNGAWGTQTEKLWATRDKRRLMFILWETTVIR